MKPNSPKLQQIQKEQTTELEQQQQSNDRTFETPEEMLRFDAAQTEVPEAIKSRLADSVAREAGQPRPDSWWRRLFSR